MRTAWGRTSGSFPSVHAVADRSSVFGAIEQVQGLAAKPVEPGQILQARQPDRQIEILALVPKLDACASIAAETRQLLPQGSRHGTDQGYPLNRLNRRPRLGERIGRPPEFLRWRLLDDLADLARLLDRQKQEHE